jgi:uncharacterized membrane protein
MQKDKAKIDAIRKAWHSDRLCAMANNDPDDSGSIDGKYDSYSTAYSHALKLLVQRPIQDDEEFALVYGDVKYLRLKDIVKAITKNSEYEQDRDKYPGLRNLTEPHVQMWFLPNHKKWLVQKSKQARQTGSTATKSGRQARRAQIRKQLDREGLDAAARDAIKQIMRRSLMPPRQELCDDFLLCNAAARICCY